MAAKNRVKSIRRVEAGEHCRKSGWHVRGHRCRAAAGRRLQAMPKVGFGAGAGAQVAAPLLDRMTVFECSRRAAPEARRLIARSSPELDLVDSPRRGSSRAGSRNLSRLRLTAKLRAADAADTGACGRHRVSIASCSTPCTASGVVRRIGWQVWCGAKATSTDSSHTEAFAGCALALSEADGKLLYATCSILALRQGQIDAFVLAHRDSSESMCALRRSRRLTEDNSCQRGRRSAQSRRVFFYALLQENLILPKEPGAPEPLAACRQCPVLYSAFFASRCRCCRRSWGGSRRQDRRAVGRVGS